MAAATDGEFGDQAGVIELLWEPREPPRRGPKPALSIDRIAHAAVGIADSEGLVAVSMQRVANQLGFTKMALYRYVVSKAELLAVMIEQAVGDPPDLASVPGDWRGKLEEWARLMWATWDRHPWLPGATVGDRVVGPREFGWTESAVNALLGSGLEGRERMNAVVVLSGHIRNTQSMATAGTQPWTTGRLLHLLHAHAGRFPALTTAVESSASSASSGEDVREFGLRRLLDGLEKLIAERSPSR
jgi:AcrR family transcriptional regulator